MLKKAPTLYLAALAVALGAPLASSLAFADNFNPMNMMNPGKWFGKKDRYGSDGDYPPPPAAAYGAPIGGPYGAPPPYGAPLPYGAPAPGMYGPAPAYNGGYGPAAMAPETRPLGTPISPGYQTPSYQAPASSGPSRAEMENRIQELEQRLQDMEARAKAATPPPQPTTPPPTSYQYYSGDQTPTPSYPFRPMDLGK